MEEKGTENTTLGAGKTLAWIGAIIGWVCTRIGGWASLGLIVAFVLVLWGCYWWATGKGRNWAFMFWGLLAPIGFLGISLLRNKNVLVQDVSPAEQIEKEV